MKGTPNNVLNITISKMSQKAFGYVRYRRKYHPVFVTPDCEIEGSVELSIPSLDFQCPYLFEDLPLFMRDAPHILAAHFEMEEARGNKTAVFRFRLTHKERQILEKKALQAGYKNTTAFVREKVLS